MLLFLMKGKLTHIDLIFPIIAGLKNKNPRIKIKLIFPSKTSLITIKDNKALYKSICDIAEISNFLYSKEIKIPYIPISFFIIFSIIHRNYILKNLLFQKVYIFRISDVPRTNWLISINRFLFKGKKISLYLNSNEFNQFLATIKRTYQISGKIEQSVLQLNTNSDVLITSYNYNQLKSLYTDIDKQNYKINVIGTNMFSWPTWKTLIIKHSKSEIKSLPKRFIFFPLAILVRKEKTFTRDFRESILKIISFIREKNNNIKIIFRPHPTTDIKELNIFLKDNDIKNYIISYANPIILLKYCSFVVRYGASLLDSRVMDSGKYLIRYFYNEIAEDMKEELKYSKNLFEKYNFIDVTDEKDLQKVIHKTLNNNKYKEPPIDNRNYEDLAIEGIFKIINNTEK